MFEVANGFGMELRVYGVSKNRWRSRQLLAALVAISALAAVADTDKSDKAKQSKELVCRGTLTDKPAEVVERCTALIDDNPKPHALANDLWVRALYYTRMGNLDAAFADSNRAVELEPDNTLALSMRANTYLLKGMYPEARADCEHMLRLKTKDDVWAWTILGDIEAREKNYAKAVEDYTRVIEVKPNEGWILQRRGQMLQRERKYLPSIADNDEVLQLDPENAGAALTRSYDHLRRNEAGPAIDDANLVLRLKPDSATALRYRGHAYLLQGKFTEALADFTHATEIEPKNPEGWVGRGSTFRMQGQNDQALAEYDHALQLDPRNSSAILDKAAMALARGDAAAAISLANSVIEKSPDYAAGYRVRGNAEFALEQWDKAAADFAKAAKLTPERAYAAIWQYLSVARGGGDGKPELLQELAAMPPGEWPIQVGYFFAGKEKSAGVLNAATSPDPYRDNQMKCEAYFYLGQAALLAGDKTGATAYFEKSVATGVTNFIEYQMAVAELKKLNAPK